MNFLEYKTAKELFEKTGLTVSQAINQIDQEIQKLKNKEKN